MWAYLAIPVAVLLSAMPARALDLPVRKAGLWELKMSSGDARLSAQVIRECVDGATDKMMNNTNMGGAAMGGAQPACSKQELTRNGATLTLDSVCTVAGAATTSHAEITGSFDRAYTMKVLSKRAGGPALPGFSPSGESRMTIEAKWLGPCAAGQRPGDIMMANGMKVNVRDLQKMRPPAR